ncbi:PMS1 protein homolog 1 [Lingula anatina]|uniref:PMS1 protein homolog 1 n=1 Tax=Lingula anatina TaxID=7574 RepID=A0A1S3ICX2_LINAN|nr:PMS1 protein homolog 1 [Lingula anatina]|eukprot:XP_013396082.2 PMS1 protein homolog 1 [Lingula anatina]
MSRLSASPVLSSQSVKRASSTNGSKLLTGQQTLYDLIDSQPIKMQRLEGERPKTKKRKTKEANEKNDNFPQRKVVTVNVTIQTLKKRLNSYHNIVSQPDATFETPYVIGPLKSHGVWMCRHGNSIAIFNHYRAQEVILFQRLLETFNFEMESLEQPIEITENMFPSRALWDVLLSMQQTLKPPDPHVHLTDKLLTANGFDIRMYEDDDGSKKVHIYKMATCLPFYGVQDLTEILHMVSRLSDNGYHSPNHHGGHSLDQCRPQKVRHFLQGEAVRMARKAPCNTNKDEIEDILNQFEESQNASHNNASKGLNLREVCLHNKRIWCILHNLPQLSSQDDSSILSQD